MGYPESILVEGLVVSLLFFGASAILVYWGSGDGGGDNPP